MKKLFLLLLILATNFIQAQEPVKPKHDKSIKEKYEYKVKVIGDTQYLIDSTLKVLNEMNFKANKQTKKMLKKAMKELKKAKKYKKKQLKYAQEKKWEQAHYWAEKHWQKQIIALDLMLQAKNILKKA